MADTMELPFTLREAEYVRSLLEEHHKAVGGRKPTTASRLAKRFLRGEQYVLGIQKMRRDERTFARQRAAK